MTRLKKSIVIFTNFWDAEDMIKSRVLLVPLSDSKVYKINLILDPQNFSVHSVALKGPSFEKMPNLQKAYGGRIDVFCPTYDLLDRYKNQNYPWEDYIKDYMDILKDRKERAKEWIISLNTENIYILCCWENTSKNAHCHRHILYDVILKSKFASSKIFPIYRSGAKTLKASMDLEQIPCFHENDVIYESI